MQIAENWSRIRGRVEAWQPPRKAGDPGTLTIVVDQVDDVASPDGSHHRNLLANVTGTTVRVLVPASVAQRVDARKGLTAEVEVRRGKSTDRVFAHPDRITLSE